MKDTTMTDAKAASPAESTRGFWALIVTQFQGAFSDNTLKWLAISMVTSMSLPKDRRDLLVAVIGGLFAVPFILFSMTGGYLADRFSKRTVVLGVKCFEILVMAGALAGLAAANLWLTLGCVFLMGVHSAIFGPSKYGLLTELIPDRQLSWGNGVLEFGTFIAIIGGTVAGGWLFEKLALHLSWAGIILIALAVAGLLTGLGITKVPAAHPAKKFNVNFIGDLWAQIRVIRRDRVLLLAVVGNTYFFGVAALLQFIIVVYTSDTLGIQSPAMTGYLQAATAIGIGLGSFAAGALSGGRIERGLIPLGALGLTVLAAALGNSHLNYGAVAALLAVLGFFGGFFIVPISALLQHQPAREEKGAVLGAANLISFIGIFLASGIYYLLTEICHLTPPEMFWVVAAAAAVATVYVWMLLPGSLLRFVIRKLSRLFFKFTFIGRDHVPEKGGALLVCNHVSFADAVLVGLGANRPVRFLMYKGIHDKFWVKPFARALGAIPVSSGQRPREMLKALATATEAIKNGELVCIFAEGEITRTGLLLPFRRGFERIMQGLDAPIIPVALDNVIGGPMSYKHAKFVPLLRLRRRHPVTVNFGRPMPAASTPFAVREAVEGLITEAWPQRRAHLETLPRTFVRTGRARSRQFAMADPLSGKLTFGGALTKSVFLARRLRTVWQGQGMVGIFLPPGIPGALVNHAAFLCGKVPVNLNYTLSEGTIAACAQQCGLKTVITSRKFLEKLKLTPPGEIICLEDLAAKPGPGEKIAALLFAKFAPFGVLTRWLGTEKAVTLDDPATVIFSSGSTGEPKGAIISQYNLMSNIAQCDLVFELASGERILGILPFFHSFGFAITLGLPAVLGSGVVFHPNPLDGKTVGALVREYSVTVLLATPTFLQIYLRSIPPEDFGSLKLVVTGAEKLPQPLAAAFEEFFGIRPFEGYGCTECSPVVACNTFDYRAAGFRQVGAKRGYIGHPLPGMSIRIADAGDPWADRPLPPGQAGLLLVRGPNIMQGYIAQPALTAAALRDGWYCTGDMAVRGEDGFLQITGRLSRFSKIGGEMVPHIKIEETLQTLQGGAELNFVVTAVPDEKKGERLVVLHRLPEAELAACLEKFAACELPNLWKPRADAFCHLDSFPLLGTGKLDLRRVRQLAEEFCATTGEGK